jgi:hypothetical protein
MTAGRHSGPTSSFGSNFDAFGLPAVIVVTTITMRTTTRMCVVGRARRASLVRSTRQSTTFYLTFTDTIADGIENRHRDRHRHLRRTDRRHRRLRLGLHRPEPAGLPDHHWSHQSVRHHRGDRHLHLTPTTTTPRNPVACGETVGRMTQHVLPPRRRSHSVGPGSQPHGNPTGELGYLLASRNAHFRQMFDQMLPSAENDTSVCERIRPSLVWLMCRW